MDVLFIQELLFNIIEFLSYQDFINLKLTNKKIYNLTKGYNDNFIFNTYIKKLPYYQPDDIIRIINNYDIISFKYILKKACIPFEQFRIHKYYIAIEDKEYENDYISDHVELIHLTFYYNGYHQIKITSISYYDADDSDNNYGIFTNLL